MTKTRTRPRYQIAHAVDNGPTVERLAKSVFTKGSPPRVLTTVQALLNAQSISQDAANAAERWYRDYVFGKCGYVEYKPDYVPDTTTKHDDISWQVVRANAWGHVLDVKFTLGKCAHTLLEMMLADEMTLAKIGERLFPSISRSLASNKANAQCCIVLETLAAYYQSERSKRARDKTCTAVH
ncbi:hypothetical protein [Acetobacter orientalis]|uniref:Uncharacterized protein n=1 Tax=Acetobacter orientalis TaxID=146474 RepID=A0A0D6NLD1_9PROT|nr:hypothetical protein [Acetobacter orientalis]GAN66892.1 hypothetical protein Abor_031_058 [Acetobacter orientalis]GBR14319.1 hypothetical protein AA0481_0581 [Acetobacter orientalis NRIC 0481]GEL60863.1 hypothetical protein AOR02nite_07050 [Acetobacter orientalis]